MVEIGLSLNFFQRIPTKDVIKKVLLATIVNIVNYNMNQDLSIIYEMMIIIAP
jgi:hypothetical protein